MKEMSPAALETRRRINNGKAYARLRSLRYSVVKLVNREQSIFTPLHLNYLRDLEAALEEMMQAYKDDREG